MKRLLGLLVVAALAGCGGGDVNGKATLWVTRDRGERVLLVRTVPAGLTALQALDREADVETRHGGRFVQSIDGVKGSLSARQDWFYFVNGYEVDRGAAEYRLHPGDRIWWDFRPWGREMRVPIVVGAFPEPFLHGFDGKRRKTYVRATTAAELPAARALARVVRGAADRSSRTPADANEILVTPAARPLSVRATSTGGPVRLTISRRDALRLARNPRLARFRYEGLP